MRPDLRWAAVTAINLLYLVVVSQVNHYLSHIPLYIYSCAVPVTFAAIRLNLRQGMTSIIVTGLFFDAGLPVRYGTSMILFCTCFVILHLIRSHFHREERFAQMLTALIMNMLLFGAMTYLAPVDPTSLPGGAATLSLDFLASQLFCGLTFSWFCALQLGILGVFGINLDEEQREAI